jgi:very-short-patch-repair endonuclease
MSLEFAKQLRKKMTVWETHLWGQLRRNQFGVRFHRQEPIGKYVADFACRSAWLIVEADGEHHNSANNDFVRDNWLKQQGWRILRFPNHQIMLQLDEVCDVIDLEIRERLNPKIKAASRRSYLPKP